MKPILWLLLAMAAAPAFAQEPLVKGSRPPPLVSGSETAPLVQQAPSRGQPGGTGPAFIPQYRYQLEEEIRDLDRRDALGRLTPLGRRELLETEQKLHNLDRGPVND